MEAISKDALRKIDEIINKYHAMKTPVMMVLSDIQREFGYIPADVQRYVAEKLDISEAEIYGVVTFYSFFSLTPRGKNIIGICLGTACYVKGANLLVERITDLLKIKTGQTTSDGLFTIDALRCVGACGVAPAVVVNGDIFPYCRAEDIDKIIQNCLRKDEENEHNS